LRAGNGAQRTALAKELGLQEFKPQLDFADCHFHIDAAQLASDMDTSIVEAKCGYDLNIVVLGKSSDGLWSSLDSLYLYAAYDELKLQFASVIRPTVQEIIVHKACTASGSLYEAYFLVFTLENGRLRPMLATLENASEPHFGGKPRRQASEINIKPVDSHGSGEIVQTVQMENGDQSYTIRRTFSWNDQLRTFLQDGVDEIKQQNKRQRPSR
jgi:hypothetical protein